MHRIVREPVFPLFPISVIRLLRVILSQKKNKTLKKTILHHQLTSFLSIPAVMETTSVEDRHSHSIFYPRYFIHNQLTCTSKLWFACGLHLQMNTARGQRAFFSKQLPFKLKHLNIHSYREMRFQNRLLTMITMVSKQPALLSFKLYPGVRVCIAHPISYIIGLIHQTSTIFIPVFP